MERGAHPLENLLLRALPRDAYARLEPSLKVLFFDHHHLFFDEAEGRRFSYFPIDSTVSLIAGDLEGRSIEVASVGREGVVGVPGTLPAGGPIGVVVQQVAGSVARIRAHDLSTEIGRDGALARLLPRYQTALLSEVAQGMVCLRHHPVESRLARWLLRTSDHTGRHNFTLTHDFLALMLGQTRPQVTVAAGTLRQAGLIDYTRGDVRILDRDGLEAASCDCYAAIRAAFAPLAAGETAGD